MNGIAVLTRVIKAVAFIWINIYTITYAIYECKKNKLGCAAVFTILATADITAVMI